MEFGGAKTVTLMGTFKTIATLRADGTVTIDQLPFHAGDEVEVIVTRVCPDPSKYPLWGTVLRYDEPTEPVGVEDWEALQ